MKKTLITCFTTFILLFTGHGPSIAQGTGKAAVHNQPEFISKYFEGKSRQGFSGETPIMEISIKAVRHFIKTFGQAENVFWHKSDNGMTVFFTENGIASRADYDRKGNWLYNIRTYEESKLDKEIRAIVKRTYYDYSITAVNEIRDEQPTAYIIQIEDKTTLKTISIYDGEMNVMKEYVKSK